MASFGSNGIGGGGPGPVTTVSNMVDPREVNSLQADFARGVGKAHRQVVYSHGEHRNFRRSSPMPSAVVVPR